MKKLILTGLLMAVLTPFMSRAQSGDFDKYFTIGPKVGVNFSKFDGVDNSDGKTGFAAGAFMVYSFQEHFGVSLDLLYSMEGDEYVTTYGTNGSTFKSESKTKVSYLRIPLLANVFFGEHGNTIRPKVFLGPSIGFLLAAEDKNKLTETNASGTSSTSSTIDIKDRFTSTDFGAVAGAGLNIKLAEETWLNFDVDYYLGATDILDIPSSNDAVKNRNLGVSLGVGFGI